MTQRYMDFAPVKKTTARGAGVSQGRTASTRAVGTNNRQTVASSSAMRGATATRPVGTKSFDVKPVAKPKGVKTVGARSVSVKPMAKKPTTARLMTTMPSAGAVPRSRIGMRASSTRQTTNTGVSVNVGRVATKKTTTAGRVKLGEIEDLSPRFVKKDVPKRPLNDGSETNKPKEGVTEVKSKKIGGRLRLRSSKNSAKPKNGVAVDGKNDKARNSSSKGQAAYTVPKSPFINQDKVAKRPLSRNIYHAPNKKAVEVTSQMIDKKAGHKTTTIIDKPAKDSKIGMVVAIILTIILGAVAGTVAFLLLPK